MSTDAELRDEAVVHLKKTTVGYVNKYWQTPPLGSEWQVGLDTLAQIGAPPPPPPDRTPEPPVNNPVKLVLTGKPGAIDAVGKDVVVSGVANQARHSVVGENPVILVKNAGTVIFDDVLGTHDADLQSNANGIGIEYGYGVHLKNVKKVWGKLRMTGPTLAQALIIDGVGPIDLMDGSVLDAGHPVWHTAKGAQAEVHTDTIQSWNGPTWLGLWGAELRGCGSLLQLQVSQYGGVKVMLGFHYEDTKYNQYHNGLSDEDPYMVSKTFNGSSGVWPTYSKNVTYHVIPGAIPFGVGWKGNDPAAYAPGGIWANTGEAWVAV